jgi:hypothetical protein
MSPGWIGRRGKIPQKYDFLLPRCRLFSAPALPQNQPVFAQRSPTRRTAVWLARVITPYFLESGIFWDKWSRKAFARVAALSSRPSHSFAGRYPSACHKPSDLVAWRSSFRAALGCTIDAIRGHPRQIT